MSVIKNLWWFFRLEKRRYLIGILALSLVSVLNLIPPKVMGHVIDHITNKNLNKEMLLWDLFYLLLSAFAMYGLRYVWRIYILGTSYRLGQIMRSRLFEHFGQEVDGSHLAGRYQHFLSQQGQELPQAHAFLSNVKDRGHMIYAATNGVSYIQRGRLQASSILPFFDDIFISDEVGAHKPSTDFFEKISDQVNDFHSDSALMIGDSLTADIQGGNNAGIDSIWFNPKGLVNETPAVPTYQVKNYQEILTILSK